MRRLRRTRRRHRADDSLNAWPQRALSARFGQPYAISCSRARAAIAQRASLAHGLRGVRNFLGLWRGHSALRLARSRMGRPPHGRAQRYVGTRLRTLVGPARGGGRGHFADGKRRTEQRVGLEAARELSERVNRALNEEIDDRRSTRY